MSRQRPLSRLSTVFVVVASLLFSQIALARHVCPAAAHALAMAGMMVAGQPCAGMDEAQPALCDQHCSAAAQSFEVVKTPVPSLPIVVQMIVVPAVPDAVDALALPFAATSEARPPPDPVFLSTLRLRV